MTTTTKRRRRAGKRPTSNIQHPTLNVTETRAVLMVRLRRPVLDLPRDTMLMLTGGQPGNQNLELTVPGTQRRISFGRSEIDCGCPSWEWGPSEAMISRSYALACARFEHPNLVDAINRRMAKLRVTWGHQQITVPGRELVVWTAPRNAGGDR